MSKAIKPIKHKGVTRQSAILQPLENSDLTELCKQKECSVTKYVSLAVALQLAEDGYPQMLKRMQEVVLLNDKKGLGGGRNRKPIKKVTQRIKGVKVVVKGKREEIGQIEMELNK